MLDTQELLFPNGAPVWILEHVCHAPFLVEAAAATEWITSQKIRSEKTKAQETLISNSTQYVQRKKMFCMYKNKTNVASCLEKRRIYCEYGLLGRHKKCG